MREWNNEVKRLRRTLPLMPSPPAHKSANEGNADKGEKIRVKGGFLLGFNGALAGNGRCLGTAGCPISTGLLLRSCSSAPPALSQ